MWSKVFEYEISIPTYACILLQVLFVFLGNNDYSRFLGARIILKCLET